MSCYRATRDVALMRRRGRIMRSCFLGKIQDASDTKPTLENLMLNDYSRGEIKRCQNGSRNVLAYATETGLPASALYDQHRSAVLRSNLLQARRDYFGPHAYERVDQRRGQFSHTNRTGHGATTSSSTYNA